MMAFPRHGFVLLAMPKCASTSLEAALAPYADLVIDRPPASSTWAPPASAGGSPHGWPPTATTATPTSWSRCSATRCAGWSRGGATARRPESVRHRPGADSSEMSFEEFARRYVEGDPDAPTPRGRPGQFLTMDDVVEVDRVLAVERPDAWQAWFRSRLGDEVEFERRNVSPPADPELTASTRSALVDFFAPEYAVWSRLQETGSGRAPAAPGSSCPRDPVRPMTGTGQNR